MKINWFSPLFPERTDIAHYTARILPALCQKAEVTVWTNARKVDPALEDRYKIRRYSLDRMDWKALNYADYNIYNIGNDGRFHADIVRLNHLHPGVVIQHDLCVHELVCNMVLGEESNTLKYLDILKTSAGAEAVREGELLLQGKIQVGDLAVKYPLLDWILGSPLGVICHNLDNPDTVQSLTQAPILSTPIPFPSMDEMLPKNDRKSHCDRDVYTLMAFGFMKSPNRRLKEILQYLATYEKRGRFRLQIIGETPPVKALKKDIAKYGLQKQVEILGFVSDERLQRALDEADLIINLRNPTRGEASGAQMRIWNHSLPSLVSDTGWYRNQPVGTVAPVSIENEEADFIKHLDAFLADPSEYYQMGLAGWERLKEAHTTERFVDNLIQFLKDVEVYRQQAYKLNLTRSMGATMLASGLTNTPVFSSCARRLSEEIAELS